MGYTRPLVGITQCRSNVLKWAKERWELFPTRQHEHVYLSFRYHFVPMAEKSLSNFDWLIELIQREQRQTPRMLVFFTNTTMLSDVYGYITHHCGQAIGQ